MADVREAYAGNVFRVEILKLIAAGGLTTATRERYSQGRIETTIDARTPDGGDEQLLVAIHLFDAKSEKEIMLTKVYSCDALEVARPEYQHEAMRAIAKDVAESLLDKLRPIDTAWREQNAPKPSPGPEWKHEVTKLRLFADDTLEEVKPAPPKPEDKYPEWD